ncbi:hypothetical protein WJX72_005355 [[Myrmecia] bisecta]|uniref:USP domain-containing protein n=1 Tax=[Myrmecia] bisecta TaxID=41462 RepID=A0AAW1PK19_9CHLO
MKNAETVHAAKTSAGPIRASAVGSASGEVPAQAQHGQRVPTSTHDFFSYLDSVNSPGTQEQQPRATARSAQPQHIMQTLRDEQHPSSPRPVQIDPAPEDELCRLLMPDMMVNEPSSMPAAPDQPKAPLQLGSSPAQYPGLPAAADAAPAVPGKPLGAWASRLPITPPSAPCTAREREDLQAAIQASLAVGMAVELAGLENAAGEYNCFLNAIIQCLWHIPSFRDQLMRWNADLAQENAVTSSLVALFGDLTQEAAKTQLAAEGAGAKLGAAQKHAVAPTALREALADLSGRSFELGEMNDASEVLLVLYEALKGAQDSKGVPEEQQLVERSFGLHVTEAVCCGACDLRTQESAYTQYFYNTSAAALRQMKAAQPAGTSFGQLLHAIDATHRKSCDTDGGGCGTLHPVIHTLLNSPDVFTIQLAWESAHESALNISTSMAAVQEVLDIAAVYPGQQLEPHTYRLSSLACFYGAHYVAFVRGGGGGGAPWLMCDDASISVVGGWAQVLQRCGLGHIQPAVLFYTACQGDKE